MAPVSGRERVSADDASWLQMDSARNPMVVDVLLDFAGPLDPERVVDLLERRVVSRFPRFGQRVVGRAGLAGGPHWEPMDQVRSSDHLQQHAAGSDGGSLGDIISDQAGRRLERSRPLWCAHLIDRSDGSSMLLRTHHSLADGLGLVQLLYAFADPPAHGGLHPGQMPIDERVASRRWPPAPALGRPLDSARVYRKLGRLSDQANALRGDLTGTKQLSVSSPIDLDRAKAVAATSGATVNDLGLAVLAGALRHYLLECAGPGAVPDRVGVTVPVNLRSLDRPLPARLGNQIGLVFVNLPTGAEDPVERLGRLRSRMSAIKASPEGAIVRSGMAMMGAVTHRPTVQAWMRQFTRRSTAIVTNIAGPQVPLQLDGVALERFVLWVPTSGSVGLGFSLVTYAGALRIGVRSDTGVVADSTVLMRMVDDELDDIDRYRSP